ncbi:hypothetical protein [Xanthomonas translucens]|uniref:hypothetical protein n=1 Tax=Xanthomonas campestris pv. translucens TaxID=343 RepID=UPI001F60EC1C|nr:hypothetical protein [Xanthomonas translucens]UNU01217.1 hypothetical protein KBQ49_20160 [Xanthomonas translucens pv. translucens]
MKVTVALIEFNPRRNGQVVVNGFNVHVEGANLIGSDKQVAWAEKIIADAVREVARNRFRKFPAAPAAEAVDAEIVKINEFFGEYMPKLAGTKATDWINVRDYGWEAISLMLRKVG